MKIFAFYLRLNLIQSPIWLEDFRLKYDEPVDLHLTLIQPRYVDEQSVYVLKSKVAQFLSEHKFVSEDKTVEFNKLVCEQELDDTYTIMLLAQTTDKILNLQTGLKEILREYGEYVDQDTIEYEQNFRPHFTIGRDINSSLLQEVESYFETEFLVQGTLTDLVLAVVKNTSVKERKNPDNLTIINL